MKMKMIVEQGDDRLDSLSSSSSSEVSSTVLSSSESDSMPQELTSSASSSSVHQLAATGPLNDLSSLLQQLPIKRGLSKHYEGKSRSFTSLSNVRCIEDLAKEDEHPFNKKLKLCKSYPPESRHSSTPLVITACSKKLSKSRGSCSSLGARRSGTFFGNRPPIAPHTHRSTNATTISNQTALFA